MKVLIAYALALYLVGCFALVITLERYSSAASIALDLPELVDLRYEDPPNFKEISPAKAKKRAFFSYLAPIVDDENDRILVQRDVVTRIQHWLSSGKEATQQMQKIIATYSEIYGVDQEVSLAEQVEELLLRVNIVPRSLTLAQAANESAWGTSRFAVRGNNYFGQWCFSQGCGLVPRSRGDSASHEVRAFSSPAESVRAYIYNINTHPAYATLRQLRADAENENRIARGSELAAGLLSYSERGEEYIKEIRQMIRSNKLQDPQVMEQLGTR